MATMTPRKNIRVGKKSTRRSIQEEDEEQQEEANGTILATVDDGTGLSDIVNDQCELEPFDDSRFVPGIFQNTPSISFVHYNVPRFGNHSKDITNFIVGSKAERVDYRRGLTSSSIAILVVATLWMIVLCICKWKFGPKQVGWFSGQFKPLPPRPRPKTSTKGEEEEEEGKQDNSNIDGDHNGDGDGVDDEAADGGVQSDQQQPSSSATTTATATTTGSNGDAADADADVIGAVATTVLTNGVFDDDNDDGEEGEGGISSRSSNINININVNSNMSSSTIGDVSQPPPENQTKNNKDEAEDEEVGGQNENEEQNQQDQQMNPEEEQSTAETVPMTETEWIKQYDKVRRMHLCFRVICWVSASLVVIGNILMIVNGVSYLKSTIDRGARSLNLAQGLVVQASDLIEDSINATQNVHDDVAAFLLSLNDFCPLLAPQGRVCTFTTDLVDGTCEGVDSNVTLLTQFDEWKAANNSTGIDKEFDSVIANAIVGAVGGGDNGGDNDESSGGSKKWIATAIRLTVGFDLETASQQVVAAAAGSGCNRLEAGAGVVCDAADILGNSITSRLSGYFNGTRRLQTQLYSLHDSLIGANDIIEDTKATLRSFDWSISVAMAFMILSSLIALFLLCSLTFPRLFSSSLVQLVQRRFVIASFVVVSGISLIFTCTFILGSIAVSDVCVDGPEERLLSIAAKYTSDAKIPVISNVLTRGFQFTEVAYEFIRYYLKRCAGPPLVLDELLDLVNGSRDLLLDLQEKLTGLSLGISDTCGADESDGLLLTVLTTKAREYMCGVAGLFRSFRELVRCSNIYPLYEELMHETVCFASSDAFWWITATNFFVALAGLTLMTFRAAFFEIEIEEEEEGNANGPPDLEKSVDEGMENYEASEKL